eukprot:707224-Prymnesium_polylepis.1
MSYENDELKPSTTGGSRASAFIESGTGAHGTKYGSSVGAVLDAAQYAVHAAAEAEYSASAYRRPRRARSTPSASDNLPRWSAEVGRVGDEPTSLLVSEAYCSGASWCTSHTHATSGGGTVSADAPQGAAQLRPEAEQEARHRAKEEVQLESGAREGSVVQAEGGLPARDCGHDCCTVKNFAVSSHRAASETPSGPALSLHFKRVVGHERSRDGSLHVT